MSVEAWELALLLLSLTASLDIVFDKSCLIQEDTFRCVPAVVLSCQAVWEGQLSDWTRPSGHIRSASGVMVTCGRPCSCAARFKAEELTRRGHKQLKPNEPYWRSGSICAHTTVHRNTYTDTHTHVHTHSDSSGTALDGALRCRWYVRGEAAWISAL